MQSTRRQVLRLASAGYAGLLLPLAEAQSRGPEAAQSAEHPVPLGTRGKFDASGAVLPFAGNTVIAHLPAEGTLRDATVALGQALLSSPVRKAFAVLPPTSYHMTVFSGINDVDRTTKAWPAWLPRETSIEDCTGILEQRLAGFAMHCPLPIRMRLNVAATMSYNGCSLRLLPADDNQGRNLRQLRDTLSDLFGTRAADHETYEFHITIAYQLRDLQASEDRLYRALVQKHARSLAASSPILELGLPELCYFKDMRRYDVLRYLRTA